MNDKTLDLVKYRNLERFEGGGGIISAVTPTVKTD